MGTFMGHVMPGCFFLLFGLWWTYNIWDRHWEARKTHRRYSASLSFPLRRGSRVPMEGIVLLICMVVGIIGELVTGWRDGHLAAIGNGQHATMYMTFGLAAIADILHYAGLSPLPGLEYAMTALAFSAEALLFATHGGSGTPALEAVVHLLLLLVVLGCIAAVLLEMSLRRSVLAALARAFFTLLQGSWFIQVGFILNTPEGLPKWDTGSYRQEKIATMMFVWHWAGVVVVMATMGFVLQRISNKRKDQRVSISLQETVQKEQLLPSSEDEM